MITKPITKPTKKAKTYEFAPILDFFNNRTGKGKKAKITIGQLVVYQAGERSRYPGAIYVTKGDEWLFRIECDGSLTKNTDNIEALDVIKAFALNPTGFVAQYGQETGKCCFCNLKLSDSFSVDAGYGPICAAKWDLPYGNK